MLKKIARDILIVLGIGVMLISTSHRCMEYLSTVRWEQPTWWGTHAQTQGDLVSMSYLDLIKKYCTIRDYAFIKPAYNNKPHTHLYCYGDSYVSRIPDTAYAGVNKYRFAWRYRDDISYNIDTSGKNVLLIEVAERYVRTVFNDPNNIYGYVYDSAKKAKGMAFILPYKPQIVYAGSDLSFINKLFNPDINQNLEFNLFNYNIFNRIIEAKALLNYSIFNRASGNVVLSNDKQNLFLKETTIPDAQTSSYATVSDDEINFLVENMNKIYDHYKAGGFDEVYLSMIPNAATIEQPDWYNNLIPRIQNHKGLHIKVIDSYTPFSNSKERIYRPGDTHWNNNGLQMWLHIVNDSLIKCNGR